MKDYPARLWSICSFLDDGCAAPAGSGDGAVMPAVCASCFFCADWRRSDTRFWRHPIFPKGTNITLLNCTVRHHPTQSTPPQHLATGHPHAHHIHSQVLSLVRRGDVARTSEFRCACDAYMQNMVVSSAVAIFSRGGLRPPAPLPVGSLCALSRGGARFRQPTPLNSCLVTLC